MPDLTKLNQYIQLTDKLIEIADKDELAECARLLALNLAHYQMRYGELPLNETGMTDSNTLSDQQTDLVTKSMETMVGVLGSVIQGLDEKISH